jgi:hypothetical protein
MSGGRDHIWPFTTDWASCVAPLSNFAHSIHLVTSGDVSPRSQWYTFQTIFRHLFRYNSIRIGCRYIQRARNHMGSSESFARRVLAPCYTHHKDIVIPPILSDPHRRCCSFLHSCCLKYMLIFLDYYCLVAANSMSNFFSSLVSHPPFSAILPSFLLTGSPVLEVGSCCSGLAKSCQL